MANSLTYRQRAKIHQKEANAFDALAKLKMKEGNDANPLLTNASVAADYLAVIQIYEQANAYDFQATNHQSQADANNAQADATGEP